MLKIVKRSTTDVRHLDSFNQLTVASCLHMCSFTGGSTNVLKQFVIGAWILGAVTIVTGCEAEGVGDPCTPESVQTGGFDSREVYLEPSSVQCRTRLCLVYHLAGDPSNVCAPGEAPGTDGCLPESEINDRVYCSCRCGVPDGVKGETCDCPDGYVCEALFESSENSPGIAGSYCVKKGVPAQ